MTSLVMQPHNQSVGSWQYEDSRFQRLLLLGVVIWLVFSLLVPMLSVPERSREVLEQLPPQLARVILEQKKAPPPPEPEPQPEQKVEPPKPEPVPEEPVAAVQEPVKPDPQKAREQAQQAGLMAMRDELADLRQSFQINNTAPKVKSSGDAQAAQVERKLLRNDANKQFAAAEAAAVAGDIARSELADTGSVALSETELKGLSATGRKDVAEQKSATSGSTPGRSEADIRRVLEANKSSLYTLYSRALRTNPLLKGKVVFELVIRADGSLAEVTIVQSELKDAKLERQLTLRLRSVNFGAAEAALTRSQWTVEFLPG